jgi:hypothetical protein
MLYLPSCYISPISYRDLEQSRAASHPLSECELRMSLVSNTLVVGFTALYLDAAYSPKKKADFSGG